MTLPRLHAVTDDAVIAAPEFAATAAALLHELGPAVAIHLRGHRTPVRRLLELATQLAPAAEGAGARLLIADRVDVALATPRLGVRLGRLSLPIGAARRMLGDRLLAYSAHDVGEAVEATAEGADFIVLGTIWETPSHPGRAGAGPALVAAAAARVPAPIIAIGGVTPGRARGAVEAGAYGVAVLRGIWGAADPPGSAAAYAAELARVAGAAPAAPAAPAARAAPAPERAGGVA